MYSENWGKPRFTHFRVSPIASDYLFSFDQYRNHWLSSPFFVFAGLSAVQSPSGLVGVYNGETLVYEESSWFIINMIKLIWHYGFQSLRMHMWVEDILDKFMR